MDIQKEVYPKYKDMIPVGCSIGKTRTEINFSGLTYKTRLKVLKVAKEVS